MTKYRYEIDGKIFETLSEAEEYCEEQEISSANVVSFEESSEELIEDNPEEIPLEEGSVSEDELRGRVVLEQYGEIKDETLKGMVLSTALGQSSISDDPKAHAKYFKPVRTTENEIRLQYERLVEDLQDEKSIACPICNVLWTKLAKENLENLSKKNFSMKKFPNQFCVGSDDWAKTHGMMKGRVKQITKGAPIGITKLIHIRSSHPNIFKTLQAGGLFQIPKDNDDKPESCSKPEELSADQSRISDNKVFLEQLSKKAKEGLDLTPAERKRLFDLWKGAKETK